MFGPRKRCPACSRRAGKDVYRRFKYDGEQVIPDGLDLGGRDFLYRGESHLPQQKSGRRTLKLWTCKRCGSTMTE